jgi:hypothetical protein
VIGAERSTSIAIRSTEGPGMAVLRRDARLNATDRIDWPSSARQRDVRIVEPDRIGGDADTPFGAIAIRVADVEQARASWRPRRRVRGDTFDTGSATWRSSRIRRNG